MILMYSMQIRLDMRFTIDILKYDDISKVLNLIEKMEKVSFNRQNRTVVVNMR